MCIMHETVSVHVDDAHMAEVGPLPLLSCSLGGQPPSDIRLSKWCWHIRMCSVVVGAHGGTYACTWLTAMVLCLGWLGSPQAMRVCVHMDIGHMGMGLSDDGGPPSWLWRRPKTTCAPVPSPLPCGLWPPSPMVHVTRMAGLARSIAESTLASLSGIWPRWRWTIGRSLLRCWL